MMSLPDQWQTALGYSRLGLPIVPVNGKVPLLYDWPNKASCDEAQISELAQEHPTANIAVIVPKGLLIVDVDIRADGDGRETLQALEKELVALPDTVTAKSGGGGLHLWYKVPQSFRSPLPKTAGPRVDLLGKGRLVVMPPSIHESGRCYEWLTDSIESGTPAEIPIEFLNGLLRNSKKSTKLSLRKSDPAALIQQLAHAPEGTRNESLFKVACEFKRRIEAGHLDGGEASEQLLNAALRSGLDQDETVNVIERGFKAAAEVRYFSPANDDVENVPAGKPTIIRQAGRYAKCVHESALALENAQQSLYLQGNRLIQRRSLKDGETQIVEVTPDLARVLLADNVNFVKRRTDKDGNVEELPQDPPVDVARSVIEMGLRYFKELRGTVSYPMLYKNHFVVENGFHAETGWFVDHELKCELPAGMLKRDAAHAALSTLTEPLDDFPFDGPISKSVVLASMMTVILCPTIDASCPMFIFDSPTPGSGKSTLVDIASILATGHIAPKQVYVPGAELRKNIFAHLLNQVRILCFDNVSKPLGGDALDVLLTGQRVTDRILRKSETTTIEHHCVTFATGNNITIKGDLHRRALRARLTPKMENPEHRGDYKHPQILEYVKTHRAELVAACLLIAKAYLDAGSPDVGLAPLGSFESWSKLVRNPLVWLGLEDPVQAQPKLREDADIDRVANEDLIVCFDNLFHKQSFTAGEVLAVVEGRSAAAPADTQRLTEILSMLELDEPTMRDITALLRKLQDRPLNGLVLRRGKRSSKGQLFRISIPT